MEFDHILPYLVSAYRRGTLVPFIGSGMSRDTCTDWRNFLLKLAQEADVVVPDHILNPKREAPPDSSELYRLADKAVHGLSALKAEARAMAYRKALDAKGMAPGTCTVPPQTAALARAYWPLVLTTNYDDLYVVSRMQQTTSHQADESDIPEVLGRSVEDCHKVLRSLDSPTRPILWALQGFVGGQAALPDALIPSANRRLELAGQVVAGHQQYQSAINAHAHFRRAFAEVLQRRSMLFLGSGILEDYLLNLFGEIAHNYGPGAHPHFALFPKDSQKTLDPRFFQARLGIIPIFYEHYTLLPQMLDRLGDALLGTTSSSAVASRPAAWMPDELGFTLSNGSRPPFDSGPRIRLRYSTPPIPAAGNEECVIASLGRDPDNAPRMGRQVEGLLESAKRAALVTDTGIHHWRALDAAPSYVYRFGDSPIFGVAARIKNPRPDGNTDGPPDRRDLGVIAEAVLQALRAVSSAGFRRIHMGAVAAGQHRLWHPIHPFIQTLVAIRQFFADDPPPSVHSLELHIADPAVWSSVLADKVPVGEILSSDVIKIWVEIRAPDAPSEVFTVIVQGPTRVGVIKKLCELKSALWGAEIFPRPNKVPLVSPEEEDDLVVGPTSTIVFSPRP